jgi:hypothetical protein
MARLFGLGAVLLGAAAWPAFTQEAPSPRTTRLRTVALPSATPTPAQMPNTGRIRRSPAGETPTPSPVYVQSREGGVQEEPTESRPARTRRGGTRTTRDPFDSGAGDEPTESVPVRSRRIPVEATPPSRDSDPVRIRRTRLEETSEPEASDTPVRRRRIPVEATPPREPGPVRVRRIPVEERYADDPEPVDTTPVRMRRVPAETVPERDPTPVRTRRMPIEERYTDEPEPRDTTPVRARRFPVEEITDPTPVRVRRIPAEEPPLPSRRTPVWNTPVPEQQFDTPVAHGRCGVRTQQQPLMARLRQTNDLQDASAAILQPPSEAAVSTLPDTLTLRAGAHGDMMRTLPTLRQIPMSVLNGSSTVTIGNTRVDFKPMIQNPKALVNIAKKLRALPDQVEICADVLEAMEVKQGLVVRSMMTYRILPGACRNEERRARLAGSGVGCFTRRSASQREAGFSSPRDPRFIKDPRARNTALIESRAQAAKIDADINASVADFRSQLGNPAQRAAIADEIGESEVARLQGLDDSALAGELANAAETKVEQIAFIPNADDAKKTFKPLGIDPGAIKQPAGPPDIDYDIGNNVFLTGFTLGRQYEWKQRVETTIKWCFVGCKKTYYAEVFAGFEYGFGLRFPIQFGGTYNPKSDTPGRAQLTVKMAPINGSVEDYKAAGLADSQLFGGKEIVAEVWAHAGASAKLPVVGVLGPVDLKIGKDFTEGLPGGLVNGQFTPPTPGDPSSNIVVEKIFDDFDLIGGRANFGVLGGKLLPAVKVTLSSKEMGLTLLDKVDNKAIPLTYDGQEETLGVDKSDGNASRFTVKDPYYNLTFNVTPGITARLFIDLAVWGNNWDWTVWFPQLAVDLPPGGKTFTCHDGTICSKDFRYNYAGKQTAFEGALNKWVTNFDPQWLPKCQDDPCKLGIGFIHQGVLFSGRRKLVAAQEQDPEADPPISIMAGEFFQAQKDAQAVATESLARKASAASNSWGVLAQAIYSKQCKDKQCYDEVSALADAMGPRARAIAKANPSQSSLWVSQQVNKEYAPQFQKAVNDSKAREAMEQSLEMQRQLNKQKGLKPIK